MTTHVFLSGFGPFAHIRENPSAAIAERLRDQLATEAEHLVVHFTECETAVRGVNEYFALLRAKVSELVASDPSVSILLCHLGVHSGERGAILRVEVEGFNELFASVPDVDGVVFNHDLIDPDAGSLTFSRLSKLADTSETLAELHSTIQRLNMAVTDQNDGRMVPQWVVSNDAGRYICNFCLYRSLELQERYPSNVVSVFIHVCDPLIGAEELPQKLNPSIETQTKQLSMLLQSLTTRMSLPAVSQPR